MKGEFPSPATFQIAAREARGLAAEVYDALGPVAVSHLRLAAEHASGPNGARCSADVAQALGDAGCVTHWGPTYATGITDWGRFVLSTGGVR